jgi:hypothetical protein
MGGKLYSYVLRVIKVGAVAQMQRPARGDFHVCSNNALMF